MANWFTRLFGKKTSDFVKEEGRYYFYNNKCSFLLPKEDIKNTTVEKGGRKLILFTDSMAMVILEIRDGMPNFPIQVQSKQITVGGLPCLAAAVGPLAALAGGYNQYFINCRKFVVQVSFTIADEEAMRFLNSFKLQRQKETNKPKDVRIKGEKHSDVTHSNTTSNEKKTKAQLNADFQMALVLNDSGKVNEAFELMKKTADAGHTRAQFNTGVFYAQGHGVKQDYTMAVIYYSMAAMLGDRDANYNLGLLFYLGQGVKESDYEKAFSYFMTAAQLGDYLAMFALSCCYKNGKGVEKDEDKGNVWLERALNTPGANPFSFIQVSNILNNPNSSDITYS